MAWRSFSPRRTGNAAAVPRPSPGGVLYSSTFAIGRSCSATASGCRPRTCRSSSGASRRAPPPPARDVLDALGPHAEDAAHDDPAAGPAAPRQVSGAARGRVPGETPSSSSAGSGHGLASARSTASSTTPCDLGRQGGVLLVGERDLGASQARKRAIGSRFAPTRRAGRRARRRRRRARRGRASAASPARAASGRRRCAPSRARGWPRGTPPAGRCRRRRRPRTRSRRPRWPGLAGEVEVRRRRVGELVVVDDEDQRQPPDPGEVHGLVRVAARRGAVAAPAHRHPRLLPHAERQRHAEPRPGGCPAGARRPRSGPCGEVLRAQVRVAALRVWPSARPMNWHSAATARRRAPRARRGCGAAGRPRRRRPSPRRRRPRRPRCRARCRTSRAACPA